MCMPLLGRQRKSSAILWFDVRVGVFQSWMESLINRLFQVS